MFNRFKVVFVVVSCLTLLITIATVASAADFGKAKEFYKGRKVELIVPMNSGGGMDNAARIAAPYLQKLLDAKSVLVINKPGAGGLLAFNWMYTAADRDGSVMCFGFHPGDTGTMEDPAVKYDPLKFNFIGTVQSAGFVLLAAPDSPLQDVNNLKKVDKLTIGGYAANDLPSLYGAVTFEAMQVAHPKLVGGYGYAAKLLLALAQKEIDAFCSPLDSVHRYVKGKQCIPLMVYSEKRDPYWPDVPTIYEIYNLDAKVKNYLDLLPKSERIIFCPPEVPKDRVDYLDHVVQQMFNDPAFKQQIIDSTGYLSGSLNAAQTRAVEEKFVSRAEDYKVLSGLIGKYHK